MPNTISPNMSLILPTVGQEPGPNWALDLNSSLSLIDQHNHTAGSGVQITPAGLNINVDLPFSSNNATGLKSARFSVQNTPLSSGLDIGCIYVSGQDLYYNDTLGNQVQITASGAVNGTPGSIGNLIAPAAVTYVPANQSFVFESDQVNATPASLDCGPVLIRNISPSSNYIQIQPNAVLPGNYAITLPSTLPAASKIVRLDNLGNLSATLDTDNVTLEISSNNLQVKDNGITLAKMADNSVGTNEIIDANVTNSKLASNAVATANIIDSAVTEPKMGANSGFYDITNRTFVAPNLNFNPFGLITTFGSVTITQNRYLLITWRNIANSTTITTSNGGTGTNLHLKIVVEGPGGFSYDSIRDGWGYGDGYSFTKLGGGILTSITGLNSTSNGSIINLNLSSVVPLTAGAGTYTIKLYAGSNNGATFTMNGFFYSGNLLY